METSQFLPNLLIYVCAFNRYVRLKRRLLVNSHPSKDEKRSSGAVMDDPLSQSPGKYMCSISFWGMFITFQFISMRILF